LVAGRARAENAKYCLVAEQGRGVADKETFNKIRENMMKRAIDIIQDEKKPEEIRQRILAFQKMAKVCSSFAIF
jgi:AmiR/NasT family two-component response regulator